jgi:hypothetical protein
MRFGARDSVAARLVLICWAHLPVRHQEGLNPVVVALLVDPIGDGGSGPGHLEALAEGPGQALQQGSRQRSEGAVEVLDRFGIEEHLAEVGRG